MPCPDVPPLDEISERWIEGNGGVIRFYSQGPIEAVRFSPEGLAAEALVENWWLKRIYDRGQMSYKLDSVCNHMDFHGIPIDYCKFDLAESGIGRRISGEGTYIGQHIDHHEDRIVQIDARSLSFREESSPLNAYGPLDIQLGGEVGQTVCQSFSAESEVNFGYGNSPGYNEPKVNEKARELLLSFLDSKQQQDYQKLGRFGYLEEAAKREWRFYFRYHYPVEFYRPNDGFIGLCIELENETPTEDILLMCLLEVRGGHGDKIIRAGRRNPHPLRDDQRLYPGGSPETIEFSGSEAELRQFRQRWYTEVLGNHGIPEQFVPEENRETATEARNIAPPLTLEQLHETFLNIADTPRITKLSCSPEAYRDLIRRNDIVLNEGVSLNVLEHQWLGNNNLYIGSPWGIELYVNPDQREPFRPMEG